jgi:hypothetical protein
MRFYNAIDWGKLRHGKSGHEVTLNFSAGFNFYLINSRSRRAGAW